MRGASTRRKKSSMELRAWRVFRSGFQDGIDSVGKGLRGSQGRVARGKLRVESFLHSTHVTRRVGIDPWERSCGCFIHAHPDIRRRNLCITFDGGIRCVNARKPPMAAASMRTNAITGGSPEYRSSICHRHRDPVFRSVLDMARLAIEAVEIRVAGELTRFSERFGRVIPNGDRVLGLALCIDDVEQQTIRGDGICREQHLLGIEAELPVRRERAGMPYTTQSVVDVEDGSRSQGLR